MCVPVLCVCILLIFYYIGVVQQYNVEVMSQNRHVYKPGAVELLDELTALDLHVSFIIHTRKRETTVLFQQNNKIRN